MIPELAGKRATLVPMRVEEADLLTKWVNLPELQPTWFGREVKRHEVIDHWRNEVFDDAYPQKGRAFRIDAGGKSWGAAIHGAVFGEPRSARLDLVLVPDAEPGLGSDALDALAHYAFDALHVRHLWAEVPAADARLLEEYLGAGFVDKGRTPETDRVILHRERPGPARRR